MCQLVLGAGAMQAASLKSITAKHLALSCQCVGVLLHLHPALVAALAAKLPAKHRPLLDPEFNLMLQVDLQLLQITSACLCLRRQVCMFM